ncbi:MAG: MTH1187 family thiamine-binding protein [Pirellulales bacterium]|nr:MTH1187 family thiamine-binding protein [Pirellulales bacterium]
MIVLAELTIYPVDRAESLSPYVARCVDVIDTSGLAYRCHAMGTVVEGELDRVMDVVRRCFEVLATDCRRIECDLRIDYRQDCAGRIDTKVASVEQQLGRPLSK